AAAISSIEVPAKPPLANTEAAPSRMRCVVSSRRPMTCLPKVYRGVKHELYVKVNPPESGRGQSWPQCGAYPDVITKRVHGTTRSKASAAASVRRSAQRGPMTWRPTGRPYRSKPAGTEVAGIPARLAGRHVVHQSSKNGSTG